MVDQVAFAQESMQDQINTVQAMKAANVATKEVMKNFDMDQMEDMMDDMKDMMDDMEEINEVMQGNFCTDFDEGALMDELNELDEEIACEQLNGTGESMPSYVPNSVKQPEQQNQDDAALKNMMEI